MPRALTLLVALSLSALAVVPAAQARKTVPRLREAPFRVLDNVEGDDIDLLNYPIKPMVVSPTHALWAVNTHNSEVLLFSNQTGQPSKVFPVPWNPVSIEYWVSSADSHHELLVVSRGTYGLTRLAPSNGSILGYLPLPAEPGGTLVVGDHLFVACSALDQVVEIDLLTNTIFQTFEVETTRHLLFLSADGLGNVLVTPLLSGNNTMPRRSAVAGQFANDTQGNVLDMASPLQADIPLPDEDVFRIVPGGSPGAGHVEVAAKGVGAMQFMHGVNPATGKLWVLNTQSVNADVVLDSEPEVKGLFSVNRLSLVTLPAPGGPPATSHTLVSLDDVPPDPLGKPFALSFASNGNAFVIGTLTDNVSLLSSAGAHLLSWNLPAGSIPRGIVLDEAIGRIYTYCWGTNEIEVRNGLVVGLPKIVDLDLGYDPTSELRKEGRRIFYDGHNSLKQNLSCESCHVEGMFDHLVWNLSGTPIDDKGVLFTQSLKGIEFTKPYHWRGERELFDFNGAFSGLLGGTNLTPTQFEAFEEFVFGLQNPANPFEHPRRVVSDARRKGFDFDTHARLSAVRGQELYFAEPSVGNDSCNDCHTLPTGTNNDFFPDELDDVAHRNTFKNTAFNGLWRKEQKTRVTVKEKFRPQEERPPLGSGSSHAGLSNGVFEFNQDNFTLPSDVEEDIALYVHQLDSGLAPSVHQALLVAQADPSPLALTSFLMPQTKKRHCDMAVVGTVDLGSGPQKLRWFWDRTLQAFRSEDKDLAPQPLSFFVAQATAGTGTNLFLGLPVGMGRRFAVDPDNDLLFRQDEVQFGTSGRDADSDDDGFLDGTEVRFGSSPTSNASLPSTGQGPAITRLVELYHTARVAKLVLEADRPVRVQVDYASNLGDVGQFVESLEHKTIWELALRDLKPSNETANVHRLYTGTVTVTDEFGHTAQAALPAFETLPFTNAFEFGTPKPITAECILRQLTFVSATPAGAGGWNLSFTARVEDRKLDAPAPLANHAVVARVIRNGVVETVIDVNGAAPATVIESEFGFNDLYGGFGGFGPFVVGSISNASGVSTLTFRLPNAVSGDQIQLSIEMAGRPVDAGTFDPTQPFFDDTSLFDLANTPAAFRASGVITLP
jgi:hypothetical protein